MSIKKNLDMIVYEKIKDSLISGEYLQGQKIFVDELTDKYGVSRTPVIQAVKLLANERILEVKSNGRIIVPQYDDKEITDICKARILIERFAVTEICDRKDGNAVESLTQPALLCGEYVKQGEYVKSCKEDLNFHKKMVALAGNDCITDVYDSIQGRFLVASYLTMNSASRMQGVASADHMALLAYLKQFDEEKAIALVEEHILSIRGQLLEIRKKSGFPSVNEM
ncbi:GntR family transcriptional regulator [Caproiciproducens sp. CPB-2]|uniref:GntR family transcriptional regulator n=1 Tax=Caproiciproducens sp. CPB-2 TaxID=3030017 RepID=UPI0023DA703F|nr:GntR family transcriptional regulator [Caproiciproducens sp. CPB-2]MDF1494754.1 GntR family transcriptional regulator [Caproiciproducens sp. CPB-2]